MAENKHRIATWLQENPTKTNNRGRTVKTTQTDAKTALDIPKSERYKIKQGNLSQYRNKLRLEPGDTNASNKLRKADQIQTTPDKNVRRRAHIKRGVLNSKGSIADHILTNSRLAKGERFIAERFGISIEAANMRARQAAESAGVGYGHSEDNIQPLTPKQNQKKELQERLLDKYYKHLEVKDQSTGWEEGRKALSEEINPKNGNGKKPRILRNSLIGGAIASASSILPSQATTQKARDYFKEGEGSASGVAISYGTDLAVGGSTAATFNAITTKAIPKAVQFFQAKIGKKVSQKFLQHCLMKGAKKLAVKGAASLVGGPYAPAIMTGLLITECYGLVDTASGGALSETFTPKQINTANRKRHRNGSQQHKTH